MFGCQFIILNESENSPLYSEYHRNYGITQWHLTTFDSKIPYIQTNSGTHNQEV